MGSIYRSLDLLIKSIISEPCQAYLGKTPLPNSNVHENNVYKANQINTRQLFRVISRPHKYCVCLVEPELTCPRQARAVVVSKIHQPETIQAYNINCLTQANSTCAITIIIIKASMDLH